MQKYQYLEIHCVKTHAQIIKKKKKKSVNLLVSVNLVYFHFIVQATKNSTFFMVLEVQ